MATEAWIAIAAIAISTLTFLANQLKLRKAERGEYVASVKDQLEEMREQLSEMRVRNKDLSERCISLSQQVDECERQRMRLTEQNLQLAMRVTDLEAEGPH